ncbi:hypothetical protein PVAP13_2KG066880 [Panicum virgatum]|uniref:BURP domain-containing protein n=2 Tax=Panicum virgatum TaxID=38727 RepID=A0A8T0VY44_PANVG|nr:hypothetical protein PVAP13_2KG066880 [Panicum virgatum]
MARGALLLLVFLFVGAPAVAKEEIRLPSPSTAHKGSFEPEAYRVKWYLRPPSPRGSSVKPEAKWDPPASAGAGEPARGIHVEPGMLFLRKSLFPGAILPEGTRLAGHGFPAPRRFISRAAADAVPFSSDQLDTILRMFRIPRGSSKAEQVAATLRTCEEASPEPHACATSQQAAAAFAASALGTGEPRAVVTVVHGEEEAAAGARYVVAPNGVARIGGGAAGVVPCHPMPYPYIVHYCHRPAGVEALRVELMAAGAGATAVAMCHADTTSWDAGYFRMLNATRGEEICHLMPLNYVLWLPAAANLQGTYSRKPGSTRD